MADTVRGDFPDAHCSDCGKRGCVFSHWGPLVPAGKVGKFCDVCMRQRDEDWRSGKPPRPLRIETICDGCNVKGLFEHRCHGAKAQVRGESTGKACQCPECNSSEHSIPSTAIVVKTKNSTYRLGVPDEKKIRAISRDEGPLDFTKCKITWLKVGYDMELACFDGPHQEWYTTPVLSIDPQ